MLKFFYRIKRRRGVVLFAVIAIMTLLIAMASTAYFTARSSYKTVVSNYDFSQMYLAATSISDMMVAGATQTSQYSGTSAADGVNFFDDLQKKIDGLKKTTDATKNPSFSIYSENLLKVTSKTDANILEALKSAEPVEPGIVDGIKSVFTLERIGWSSDKNGLDPAPYTGSHPKAAEEGTSAFYFTITTTAYYRQNMVTVQDTVVNISGVPTDEEVDPDFSTFFTATGQMIKSDGTKDKGSRAVIIDCDEISDKSYFQSRTTVFLSSSRPNKFLGGVTTSGGLYLCGQTRTDIPAPGNNAKGDYDRHDWFIGGDLALLNTDTEFDLKGNNLYVKGDVIISCQHGITAKDIYIDGNLYILEGQVQINSDRLYVGGNIYGQNNPTASYSDKWEDRPGGWDTVSGMITELKTAVSTAASRAGGYFSYGGLGYLGGMESNPKFKNTTELHMTDTGTVTGWPGYGPADGNKDYDPATITIPVVTNNPDLKEDTYKAVKSEMTLKTLFDPKAEKSPSPIKETKFKTYTSEQATYDNLLEIDLNGFNPRMEGNYSWDTTTKTIGDADFETTSGLSAHAHWDKGDNNTITITFESEGGQEAIVTQSTSDTSTIYVNIPWCDDGYLLDVKIDGPWGYNNTYSNDVIFNFATTASTYDDDGNVVKDNALPVVLKSNFYDSTLGKKGFSWKGGNYTNNGRAVNVLATNEDWSDSADGEVVFEMGNIDSTGKYIPYDKSKVDDVVVYYSAQKELVCTLAQKKKLNEKTTNPYEIPGENKSWLTDMFDKGSDPDSDYENKIMLVSNVNQGTAMNSYRFQNLFCGYIYAPNGSLYSYGDGKIPIFGGLVVSDYAAIHATYIYAEPDPRVINSILGALAYVPPAGGGDGVSKNHWIFFDDINSHLGKNYNG